MSRTHNDTITARKRRSRILWLLLAILPKSLSGSDETRRLSPLDLQLQVAVGVSKRAISTGTEAKIADDARSTPEHSGDRRKHAVCAIFGRSIEQGLSAVAADSRLTQSEGLGFHTAASGASTQAPTTNSGGQK